MGLIKPEYKIFVSGKELTKEVMELVAGIHINDEVGLAADSITVSFNDPDKNLVIPKRGVPIEIEFNYGENQYYSSGKYIVDEVDLDNENMVIRAKGFDTESELKMSKTRSFESKCIYNIVETIANDHDLVPKISQEYRTYFSDKKVLQIKKSDLTMLCELAERYGAFYRICGTTLVFIKKGDGKKANGVDREIIDVRVKDATAWSLKIKGRSKYNQVIASYVDTKTGKVEKIEVKRQEKAQQRQRRKIGTVVIGPEEIERREEKQGPPLKISLPVSTREEAEKRARSLLNSKNFENETLSISLDASPYIYAEAVINLTGFRERVDGMWIVTKVSHTIDVNEFKTDIDCQKFLEDIS